MWCALTLALAGGVPAAWCQPSADMDWEAADQAGSAEAAPAAEPVYLSVLDLVGKLTVAVLIAYGLSLALRWAQQNHQRPSRTGRRSTMRLEEVLPLGTDARLYIVSVEGRRLLLGGGSGGVHHVTDLGMDLPAGSAGFSYVSRGRGGERDELNIVHAPLPNRTARPNGVSDHEAWARRRDQPLRELQDS